MSGAWHIPHGVHILAVHNCTAAGPDHQLLDLQARHGYEMVRKWLDESDGLLSLHPVEATALAFVR